MKRMQPSATFRVFEDEANRFQIRPGTVDLRFEAKQRMIARAEAFAVREAFLVPWWRLFFPKLLSHFTDALARCDANMAAAEARATHPVKLDGDDERHRAEILLNLYARVIQQITLRRLYTLAAVAAVAAAIASIATLAIQ